MTSDQDVFRKVGRGGAGNYYSATKQDALAAEKDLERQDDLARLVAAHPSDGAGAGAASLRAGRGGAGNFVDAAQVPAAQEEERKLAQEVSQAVSTSHSNTNQMGGRGGAGNWAGEQQEEGAGLQSMEELERRVAEVVERGLKIPEKVHHGREKDVKP
ncbi:hypothetical protein E4U57_003955 [Claviceps arundinis]|uniref:Uncharacterized protein n=1 Tax=Claviceps arundinis TaxID=1623583 RepID=A0A9P7MR02_9HYPO|nr:hypothetical protein E4U57_003955 [Claviceps arundinis]KAG5963948.1 hypothetical protein E4U56_002522 [Claviceps arundinis]